MGSGHLVGKQGMMALRANVVFLNYFEGGRVGISLFKERMSARLSSLAK